MTTDLIQHAFHGQAVRVITDPDGSVWFVAADVAAILGYRMASDMTRRLDEDEKATRSVRTFARGEQASTVITEAGLYVAALGSQVPGAREFKRWVTHELLPEIRRTGSYGVQDVAQITRSDLARWVIEAETRAEKAEAQVAELEPPARAWTALADATGDYSLRDAAQILDRDPDIRTGQNRLSQYLRQVGWLDRRGIPYQRAVEVGYVRSRARTYPHPRTGEQMVGEPQVRVTGKGLTWLHKHLGGSQPLDVTERHLEVVS